MRKIKKVSFLLVVLSLIGGNLFGVAWRLERHELGNSQVSSEINDWTTRGYAPMGISLKDSALYVFYYKSKALKFRTWTMRHYYSISELQDKLSDQIDEGYIPTGLTIKNKKIFISFIKTKNNVRAWRLVWSAEDTLESFKASVRPWLAKNYIPSGISFYNGRFYTLMLKIPDTKFTKWKILRDVAKSGVLKKTVDKMLFEQNWTPWAFSYRESETYTIYLK